MPRRALALALALAFLAPPLAAGTAAFYRAGYVANPLPFVRVFGSNFGWEPGLGGSGFPDHPHATTANVTVTDRVNGPITALVCQDVNWDLVCDTSIGTPDVFACAYGGTLAGFPIQASSPGARKPTTVFVAPVGYRLEYCATPGQATTGEITLRYN